MNSWKLSEVIARLIAVASNVHARSVLVLAEIVEGLVAATLVILHAKKISLY